MQPRERRETGEQDLFRSRLDQIIDMKHGTKSAEDFRSVHFCYEDHSADFI
ncbi:hypothetical protein SAMN05444050_4321 [Afipia sp. GAS231]|nr:hypothetical protein SAMN05444050_4321 [Afipia sp. GAS231]